MSRERARERFLGGGEYAGAALEPLPADASFRRYFRVRGGPAPALLMDAPPPHEDARPFVRVAEHLRRLGFSAPAIYARDVERGLLLLEDFGDATYARLLASGAPERPLYSLALDTLAALHREPRAAAIELPRLDAERLRAECELFVEWFLPRLSIAASAALAASHARCWRRVLAGLGAQAPTLVLRDFHVDNLMRLAGRAGVAACGLLDFQDACLGPAAYDVVSLLEDARRELAPGLPESMLERYFAALAMGAGERGRFMRAYHVLGAQRHWRVLGVFARLRRRDGKAAYLRHLPRVARLLLGHLGQPGLAPLADWIGEHLGERLAELAASRGSPLATRAGRG